MTEGFPALEWAVKKLMRVWDSLTAGYDGGRRRHNVKPKCVKRDCDICND